MNMHRKRECCSHMVCALGCVFAAAAFPSAGLVSLYEPLAATSAVVVEELFFLNQKQRYKNK